MYSQLDQPISALSFGDLGVIETLSNCLSTKLEELKGRKIIFSRDDKKLVPVDGWGLKSAVHHTTVNTIRPINESTLIAAVDSSSVKLAETEDGCLYAVKSGIATAINGRTLMHFRIGPVLFYFNECMARQSELDDRLASAVLLDDELAKRLVRVRAERAIQNQLASHFHDSMILVDGSLRTSLFEDKERGMRKISENCHLHKNIMIGISKGTKLKPLQRAAAPLLHVPGPAYIEVDFLVKSLIRNSIGANLMVRFESGSPVLRADILGANNGESLGRLLGNDLLTSGYPETLRLAHYISTFTATEMTCLRSHVLNNYDVTELASDDIRRTILGSISV